MPKSFNQYAKNRFAYMGAINPRIRKDGFEVPKLCHQKWECIMGRFMHGGQFQEFKSNGLVCMAEKSPLRMKLGIPKYDTRAYGKQK